MKPFKTLDEQVDLLKKRGLIFSDESNAKYVLLLNNYYNIINCFAKFFMNPDDTFKHGTSFDEIVAVRRYDKEVKMIFFKSIIQIENYFKSILAYRFSEKFPSPDYPYLNVSNFQQNDILSAVKLITTIAKAIEHNSKIKGNPIYHYKNNHSTIPFWIITNYMNFGQLVTFYKNLDCSLQNVIAKDFSSFLCENLSVPSVQINPPALISILNNVVEVRNVVAHNNKLLNCSCKNHIHYIKQLHSAYNINNTDQQQSVYHVFIAMQALMPKKHYDILHNALKAKTKDLEAELNTISIDDILDSLGFPLQWHNKS